jgi:hypothetical protein
VRLAGLVGLVDGSLIHAMYEEPPASRVVYGPGTLRQKERERTFTLRSRRRSVGPLDQTSCYPNQAVDDD